MDFMHGLETHEEQRIHALYSKLKVKVKIIDLSRYSLFRNGFHAWARNSCRAKYPFVVPTEKICTDFAFDACTRSVFSPLNLQEHITCC